MRKLLQLCKLDGCTLRRMAYSSAATQHALQWFHPLCGVTSTGIPQPVDWLTPLQVHSLPHSAVRWCNAQWPAVQRPYRPQIHTWSSPSPQMLDNTAQLHWIRTTVLEVRRILSEAVIS